VVQRDRKKGIDPFHGHLRESILRRFAEFLLGEIFPCPIDNVQKLKG